MTKFEKLEAERDSAIEILNNFEEAIRSMHYKVGDVQSALCQVEDGDNPDEFARGMAAAYEDTINRLIHALDDMDVAREGAAQVLEA